VARSPDLQDLAGVRPRPHVRAAIDPIDEQ